MSRKLQKSIWREGHRRSPRISALDAWKAQPPRRVAHSTLGLSQNSDANSTTTSTRNTSATTVREMGSGPGPASRTPARKKRKLKPVQEVAAVPVSISPRPKQAKPNHEDQRANYDQPVVMQTEDNPKHADHATYTNQQSHVPSAPCMPEKRVLELILDILQRRDTHEIFSEPVDQDEVEDYYEIIEEPMDFGTMRAKLHEGMYKSLEQFEHDIFLIPKNAMHFNSSATIYFRQARAIHELAKKVFHVLKTDPEKFESEFSDTRKKSGRRPRGEARSSIKSSCPKLLTNVKSGGMTIDVSTKTMPNVFSGSSNIRRSFQVKPQFSGIATNVDARDHEVLYGEKDGGRSGSFETDRRCTYRPWMSFLDENESIFSTICSTSKPLEQVNQQDIGYRESLMLFVKDLGPTAQRIADRKLLGWSGNASKYQTSSNDYSFQAQKCHTDMGSDSVHWGHNTLNTIITTPKSQNFLDHLCGQPSLIRNTHDIMDLGDADKGKKVYTGDKMGIQGDKINENGNSEGQLNSYSSIVGTGDLNYSVAKFKNTGNKSTTVQAQFMESTLGCSQSKNVLEFQLKSDYSFPSSTSRPIQTMGGHGQPPFSQTKGSMHTQYLSVDDQGIATGGSSDGICSSSKEGHVLKSNQPISQASQFVFDLPYLRTRLNQINSLEPDRMMQLSSYSEGPPFAKMSYQRGSTGTCQAELSTQPHCDNQQRSSLDTQHTDLALQL